MPKDGSGFTPIGDILPSLVRPQHRPISRIEERLIEPVLDSAEGRGPRHLRFSNAW